MSSDWLAGHTGVFVPVQAEKNVNTVMQGVSVIVHIHRVGQSSKSDFSPSALWVFGAGEFFVLGSCPVH